MTDPPILYMDAEIRPHRSLSRGGMIAILGLLIAYNLILTVFMLVIGAFPVPIFLGLDVLGVLIAFKVSNARAKGELGWRPAYPTYREGLAAIIAAGR